MNTIDSLQNPWAGLSSYEDPATSQQHLKFCGRADSTYDLSQLIDNNFLVTLYGKSGIGKSSLLNAGVFPLMRRDQYTPLSIRLGMTDDDVTFQEFITTSIESVIEKAGGRVEEIPVVDEQTDLSAEDYLWNYFARHRFVDADGLTQFPIVVCDQFEEVFRHPESRRKAEVLLAQINYLIDDSNALNDCIVDGEEYFYDFNFRFVISIREDDLYRLEDSIDNLSLPALKQCRYRLRSLTEEGARDAILIPGEGLFDPKEQDGIVKAIIDKSRNQDGSISTNIISLLCNRIFTEARKKGASHISQALVDSFIQDNPFERFYYEATSHLTNAERQYIENHLVDSAGRRNSIPESDFLKHVGRGSSLLEGENRILQRVSTSSDGGHYRIELIHDSFCEPVAELKQKRESRRRMKWIGISSFIALLCLGVALYIVHQAGKIHRQAKTIAQENWIMQENRYKLIAEKGEELIRDHDSYTARLLALEILPTDTHEPDKPYTVAAEQLMRNAMMNDDAVLRGHTMWVNSAFFSPDGKYILSASDDNTIRVWDVWNGAQVGEPITGHTNTVSFASYSPDGKLIASSSWDKTIRLWDAENHEPVGQPMEGHESGINCVAFSPDGKRLVSASWDETLRLWDVKTCKQIGQPIRGHGDDINTAFFSPDGRYIVSASDDKTARLWDAHTGEPVGQPLRGQTSNVSCATFSPDGRRVATASWDGTIRLYEVPSGRPLTKPLDAELADVNCVTFSPDGKYLVSAADKGIQIWDAQTGEPVGEPLTNHTAEVNWATFSPDGKCLVSAGDDFQVRLWVTRTITEQTLTLAGHASSVLSAAFSPDGKKVVSSSVDNTIRIWDAETGELLREPSVGHAGPVYSAMYSPDGLRIVSASNDSTLRLWDAKTGLQIGEPLRGHRASVNFALFSPDGKRIASASSDSTVCLWDAKTGKMIGQPLVGHQAAVNALAFSPEGQYLASASNDKTVRIWEVKTGKALGKPIRGHKGPVRFVAISPLGRRIATCSDDKTVRIWDFTTGKMVGKTLEGHLGTVNTVRFCPDGRHVITSSNDGTIRVWDVAAGETVGTPMSGHEDWVNSVMFSPDGEKFVSASRDKTIKVWDYVRLQQLINDTRQRFKGTSLNEGVKRRYYLE